MQTDLGTTQTTYNITGLSPYTSYCVQVSLCIINRTLRLPWQRFQLCRVKSEPFSNCDEVINRFGCSLVLERKPLSSTALIAVSFLSVCLSFFLFLSCSVVEYILVCIIFDYRTIRPSFDIQFAVNHSYLHFFISFLIVLKSTQSWYFGNE